METSSLILLPLWYAVFLLSLTCHEAAHALVAYLGGDETAYLGGQVTLNPLPHVQREPVGTVIVPLISFFFAGASGGRWMMGWASAPYDPLWEDRHPARAAMMAAAGPAANLLLMILGFAVLRVGIVNGWWVQPAQPEIDRLVVPLVAEATLLDGVGRLFSIVFVLNLVLLFFNLLPVPPLDGASVISVLEPVRQFMQGLRSSTMGGWIGILVAWTVFPYLFFPIMAWAYALLYR